ncbi:MAG: diguanylate cyclase [Planctomycetaceae bacterium]|nr:diguanylate cyclase [Planctomycetaceae bacterium]
MEDPSAAQAVIAHIKKLLLSGKAPELTPELAELPDMPEIHQYLVELRRQLGGYARGDFSAEVKLRGVMAGMVKVLQANMRHLIWQMERVEGGKLAQRVDFMGEFSVAFNSMVKQLDDALTSLRLKEEELLRITHELQQEVEKRGAALSALQKSEENFKYLAEHDPLTNLLNRRSFFAQAEVEMARNTIMDNPSCIAVMDVDSFKGFNDTHGHPSGDAALRHIASISQQQLRSNDIMGRLGGEEFIFFFSNVDLEQGRLAAERIRAVIATNPVKVDGRRLPVTASFGVVEVPPGCAGTGNIMDAAMRIADEALYEAKAAGRNRVMVATFTPPEPTIL